MAIDIVLNKRRCLLFKLFFILSICYMNNFCTSASLLEFRKITQSSTFTSDSKFAEIIIVTLNIS